MPGPDPTPKVRDGLRIVVIGASAGGLDACRKLLDALPAVSGMAFIVVQHLDPKHASLLSSLLSSHTAMPVQEARDGMLVEPDHLYVIPPGTYLSVQHGGLHLTDPQARHGARLPVDFLLRSIAESSGRNGVAVILSGTGSDGSLGLQALKEQGGLVIAQDPEEASYDGMPRNAILTGAVDFVLRAAEIPGALMRHADGPRAPYAGQAPVQPEGDVDWYARILELLRMKAVHDFTLYKPGTLRRRIERRMAMREIGPAGWDQYFQILQDDPVELGHLADNLFINVTNFFRDPAVFKALADIVVPDLLNTQMAGQPFRLWVTGCSTGEEAYSLAMILREKMALAGGMPGLQIFASDADPDAVATAREGLYPRSIEADVSAARLDRFFVKENGRYRVSQDLRTMVIFTVHNVLSDPPFSRIDLISCRNLLIYLNTEAQAQALSMFHFALRDGGALVLGSAESIPDDDTRFQPIAKLERIYRHIHSRQTLPQFTARLGGGDGDGALDGPLDGRVRARSRPAALAEFCRRLVLDSYAPAAVLINRRHECLYALGPVDRYLSVAPGHPSADLFAMARDGVRGGLRAALQRAERENARVLVPARLAEPTQQSPPFHIAVQPAVHDGETLFLICFIDEPTQVPEAARIARPQEATQVSALQQELDVTRKELLIATRDLEIAHEEQRAASEEASSVTEEYQSTNEELLTSKEELQSLNEELVTLNHQLQGTLGRERTTHDDLQNVMHSTDMATLLLDTNLNIRLFTPATKSLFNILPTDLGRPLADLRSLTGDSLLEDDAKLALRTNAPVEREVQAEAGQVFRRRVLPYLSREHAVEGVVITFVNVTAQRHAANALEAAMQQADQANVVKTRFLAVASHDLRQPLQTLTLLQGLLAKAVTGERARNLVDRFEDALDAMAGILNSLLDINRIEAGKIAAEPENLSIDNLLQRLNSEFSYHARAKGIVLRHVMCGACVHTDPRLLEQILRNFLANALKYTATGRVLMGCRRGKETLRIEIWDTGIGIPEAEQTAIFEEYHQLDNPARERSRGLGLGLSIVRQLGRLLGHPITVRSRPGKGSVFAVEVALAPSALAVPVPVAPPPEKAVLVVTPDAANGGTVLVIDDDPSVLELLVLLLQDEGHTPIAAANGVSALALLKNGGVQPDIILADFNLPGEMNGLQVVENVRELLHRQIPAIILTGDISTGLLRDIAQHDCVHLNKPIKSRDLIDIMGRLRPARDAAMVAHAPEQPELSAGSDRSQIIFIVDDDSHVLDTLRQALEADQRTVQCFRSSEAFLAAYRPGDTGCLLVDAAMPGMDGLTLLQQLRTTGRSLPSIMITGFGDIQMAVRAMQAGAIDFIEKPVGYTELHAAIERALASARDSSQLTAWHDAAAAHVAKLTPRQREIMERVLAGHPSKNIAADLGISQRTVENHRAAIMKKTSTKSLPALARLALAATGAAADQENPAPKASR